MCPCFDREKFDNNIQSCASQDKMDEDSSTSTIGESSIKASEHTRLDTFQGVDNAEIKKMRDFLKSIPSNYKWGENIVAGGISSVAQTKDPIKFKANLATLRELKRLIEKREKNLN